MKRMIKGSYPYYDEDFPEKEESEDFPGYRPPKGPKESDWSLISEIIARRLHRLQVITTEDVIDEFRMMNDDWGDWWARGLRSEDEEKAVVDRIIEGLKQYGITDVKDNTFCCSDIKAATEEGVAPTDPRNIARDIERLLDAEDFWHEGVDVYEDNGDTFIIRVWGLRGDWKHDHLRATWTLEEKYRNIVNSWEDVTESDGSDYYTATHYYEMRK